MVSRLVVVDKIILVFISILHTIQSVYFSIQLPFLKTMANSVSLKNSNKFNFEGVIAAYDALNKFTFHHNSKL